MSSQASPQARARRLFLRALGLIMAAAILWLPTSPARAEGPAGDPEAVARAWVAALNRGDTEAAIGLYAEDAVILALGKEISGRPAIAQRQRTTIGPTLKPHLEIESLRADGDTVTLDLLGENAITRFDGHAPVHNTMTFTVRDGKIQREVGPVLDSAAAAWYKDAAPRFQQSQGTPTTLPRTGEPLDSALVLGAVGLGLALLLTGIALRSRWSHLHRPSR